MSGIGRRIGRSIYRRAVGILPAPLSLSIQFFHTQGRWPNLRQPQSFNEKLQWRKLHDRNPLFPILVDKVAVKTLLAERYGMGEWLIPTLWSGPRLSAEILAPIAPPYVIKPNHTSGRIIFNRGDCADLAALAARANAMLATPHTRFLHEWPYDSVPPQLLIEPFIGKGSSPPDDYKFCVFHGRVRMIQYDTGRGGDHKRGHYDASWRRMPFRCSTRPLTKEVPPPSQLDRMIALAERIAVELAIDFIRVDLYQVDGHIWFGEFTLFPASGFTMFDPPTGDLHLGRYWQLRPRRRERRAGVLGRPAC